MVCLGGHVGAGLGALGRETPLTRQGRLSDGPVVIGERVRVCGLPCHAA